MAKIERVEIHLKLSPLFAGHVVLPRVLLLKPDLYLHQERSGRANWTFENKAPTNERASGPTKLPVVRNLIIDSGKLTLIDELRRLIGAATLALSNSAAYRQSCAAEETLHQLVLRNASGHSRVKIGYKQLSRFQEVRRALMCRPTVNNYGRQLLTTER